MDCKTVLCPWGLVVFQNHGVFCRACVCVHTELSRHVRLFETPWTIVCKAPLTRSFSRREYWSGFPFPPPGDLPDPGVKPEYLAYPALAGVFFTLSYLRCPPLHGAQLHCNDLWFFRGNTRLKKNSWGLPWWSSG